MVLPVSVGMLFFLLYLCDFFHRSNAAQARARSTYVPAEGMHLKNADERKVECAGYVLAQAEGHMKVY